MEIVPIQTLQIFSLLEFMHFFALEYFHSNASCEM